MKQTNFSYLFFLPTWLLFHFSTKYNLTTTSQPISTSLESQCLPKLNGMVKVCASVSQQIFLIPSN